MDEPSRPRVVSLVFHKRVSQNPELCPGFQAAALPTKEYGDEERCRVHDLRSVADRGRRVRLVELRRVRGGEAGGATHVVEKNEPAEDPPQENPPPHPPSP